MADYRQHVRREMSAHGYFGFSRTGVKYASNGILGLKHYVPIAPRTWVVAVASGAFNNSYVYDGGTSRLYLLLDCTGTGVVRARTRFQLPRDFGSFPAGALRIVTYRNAAITYLYGTLEKDAMNDATITNYSINPASATTWTATTVMPGGTYSPGDWLTFTVELSADTIGDQVRVDDLSLEYVSGRGNV